MSTIFGLTALIFYLAGIVYQVSQFFGKTPRRPFVSLLIGLMALGSHLAFDYQLVISPEGLDFSFFKASVTISWVVVLLGALYSTRKSLPPGLMLFPYSIAFLAILAMLVFHPPAHPTTQLHPGVLLHILFSVAAYSVFTLSAIQASLLYVQNKQLRSNYNSLIVRNLPPLQTMETILFEMLYSGVILLLIAVVLGFIYVDDLFEQKLAHKTVFSLLSLGVFTTLVIGHRKFGWRGVTASKWTLAGCLLLMTGYFGSKFVLQFLLHSA